MPLIRQILLQAWTMVKVENTQTSMSDIIGVLGTDTKIFMERQGASVEHFISHEIFGLHMCSSFLSVPPAKVASSHSGRSPVKVKGKSKMPAGTCRDYAKGKCNRGDKCQFKHPKEQQHQGGRYLGASEQLEQPSRGAKAASRARAQVEHTADQAREMAAARSVQVWVHAYDDRHVICLCVCMFVCFSFLYRISCIAPVCTYTHTHTHTHTYTHTFFLQCYCTDCVCVCVYLSQDVLLKEQIGIPHKHTYTYKSAISSTPLSQFFKPDAPQQEQKQDKELVAEGGREEEKLLHETMVGVDVNGQGRAHGINATNGTQNNEQLMQILAKAPPAQARQILGECLYALIEVYALNKAKRPLLNMTKLACKITGMLLEALDHSELVNLIYDEDALHAKIQEALAVLQEHQAQHKLVSDPQILSTQKGVDPNRKACTSKTTPTAAANPTLCP